MTSEDSYNLQLIRTRLGWIIFWILVHLFWPLIVGGGILAGVIAVILGTEGIQ